MLRVGDSLVALIGKLDGIYLLNCAVNKKAWHVRMTIGNLSSKIRQTHSTHSVVMVDLIPIPINNRNISHKRLHNICKKNSVRAEWLRHSGGAPAEPSETPRCHITPPPASIPRLTLYIALTVRGHFLFAFCRSPILNAHSGFVANCDYLSEWAHWVHSCIVIPMQWLMLWISQLAFLLPVCKMEFSLYKLYTSFQVTRSMWLLTIHRSFCPSHVLLLVAIYRITCAQPTIFPKLKTCKAKAASGILTCTNFETGSKLSEFSGIVVSAWANQYSTKAPSLFWGLILNSPCSCNWRRQFSAP
jgi:hypothetical protein